MPAPRRLPTGRLFETKSHTWREVGLARELSRQAVRKARRQAVVFSVLLAGVLVAYAYRDDLLGGDDRPVRAATVVALLILGWAVARDVGRSLGPVLFRRLDPATAGTVGFLIRLVTVSLALLVALRIAGLEARTLAVGGAFTAVVLGLAAQQTLGNLIAGTVLLSARPFRVGDRVRFQGGTVGTGVSGVVSSLGLLYTILADGDERIMVPNSAVLSSSITPLSEPDAVDLRARLRAGVRPSDVQALLDESVTIPTRSAPHIVLEEVDGDEVVVRVVATPVEAGDGPRLADEVLATVARVTRDAEGDGASADDP